MKKSLFRFAALLLTAILALGLAACGKQQPVEPSITYAELMSMVNQAVDNNLKEVIQGGWYWTGNDDRVWTTGCQTGGFFSIEEMELWIASSKADGTDVVAMQLKLSYEPALLEQREQLAAENPDIAYYLGQSMSGILFNSTSQPYFVVQEQFLGQGPEDEFYQELANQYVLCTGTAEGVLKREFTLQLPESLAAGELLYELSDYVLTDDNTLWVHAAGLKANDNGIRSFTKSSFLRYDLATGQVTAQLDLPENYFMYSAANAVSHQADGSLLVLAQSGVMGAQSIFAITDLAGEAPALSQPYKIVDTLVNPTGFVQPLDGKPSDFVLLQTGSGIAQCDVRAGTAELILRWEDYGFGQSDFLSGLFFWPKGATMQFLRIGLDQDMNILSLVDQSALEALPTVTVAVFDSMDSISRAIHEYNSSGGDYYVKAVDYSRAAAAEAGFASGAEMLQQHIANHTAPDVLMLANELDNVSLVRKGQFVDLYPYIDGDAELARSDFLPGILASTEYGGTLPTVMLSYILLTAAGDTDVVGPDMGWTWDEYNALLAQYPGATPIYGYSRSTILLYLLQMGGSKFVDYESGKAYLDTPDFVNLVQATAAYPTQMTGDGTQNPKPVFAERQALLEVSNLWDFRTLLTTEYSFDGPVTYKGFPSDDGGSGTAAIPRLRVGINSLCKDPAAAWQFVRTLLLPDFQNKLTRAFPLRQDALQLAAAAAQERAPGEYSIPAYISLESQQENPEITEYFRQGLTQEQADQIVALVKSTDVLYQYDGTLTNILFEEAEYFYNGVRTAEEAAAIMQNRVQTYLDEQG